MNYLFPLALFIAVACALAPLRTVQPSARVDGSYIVVLHLNTTLNRLKEIQHVHLGAAPSHTVQFEYKTVYPGFAGQITKEGLTLLRSLAEVDFIEEDQVMTLDTVVEEVADPTQCQVQPSATWGIARVARRTPQGLPNYQYSASGGGSRVFIIDTGVRTTHNEFNIPTAGRAVFIAGGDFVNEAAFPFGADGNGHGTHCAGTAAGTQYGVAKNAQIVAVKVLNSAGSGTYAAVIAGVDFTAFHRTMNRDVGSMSLGGGPSDALDQAINLAVQGGLVVVVAGGNSNANACNSSPSRAALAVTVGATSEGTAAGDPRASFSNFGPCTNIWAPGQAITSAWSTSDVATNTISGTSMACPHVAGVSAVYTSIQPVDPHETLLHLNARATNGTVQNPGAGSPNVFVYNFHQCN